jgi:translation initiation factor 2 beta subunit (eIF-2beta)/eIF-5
MNSIEDIKIIDLKALSIIDEPLARFISDKSKYSIPKTILTLSMLCFRIGTIKDGIITLAEYSEIYSTKILYRSIIEHYLRYQYLFSEFIIQRNDDPVIEYNLFSDLSELIDYGASWQFVKRINQDDVNNQELYTVLKNIRPQISRYSIKEIKRNVANYRYRNIVKYLHNNLSSKGNIGLDNNFILNIIPEYSELSSYVHGGIYAEHETISFVDVKKCEEELIRMAEMAVLMSMHVHECIFIVAMQYDKTYSKVYNDIRKIRTSNVI